MKIELEYHAGKENQPSLKMYHLNLWLFRLIITKVKY